jgi:phage/plasmid-associated DNA primase
MSDITSDPQFNNLVTKFDECNNQFITRLYKYLSNYVAKDGNFNFLSLEKGKWLLPANRVAEFFALADTARQSKAMMHFAEPQSKGDDYSCLFLDFDIYHDTNDLIIEDNEIRELLDLIGDLIRNYFVIPHDMTTYCLITKRKNITLDHDRNQYRYGFHMIFSIKMKSIGRKIIIDRLRRSENIIKIETDDDFECFIQDVEQRLNIDFKDALDVACAWVPVLIRGSCRTGKIPHKIDSIYKMTLPSRENSKKRINSVDISDFANICYEFSINFEMFNGIVKKEEINLKDEFSDLVKDKINKLESDELSYLDVNSKVNITCLSDINAKYVKEYLDIINVDKLSGTDWRKILMTVYNQHPSYKLLAEQFSRRSKYWDQAGFDKTWEQISKTDCSTFSVGTILYYAKTTNPDEYNNHYNKSVYDIAKDAVMKHRGDLNEFDCALVLQAMFDQLYITTVDQNAPRGQKKMITCRFITPNDKMRDGEVWKWRVDAQLSDIHHFIFKKLENVFHNIKIFLKQFLSTKDDATEKKNINKMITALNNSCKRFGDFSKAKAITNVFLNIIMDESFLEKLDQDKYIMGVGNGVLELGDATTPKINLINHFHNYRISKYTPVVYIPYDANNPIIMEVEEGLRKIFVEKDAFEFIMMMASQCLNAEIKDLFYLFLLGVGANGKSTFLELFTNTLGHMYAKKYRNTLITGKSGASESANSSLMILEPARAGYCSEVSPGTKINISAFKELVSGEKLSGRGLFKDEINFKLRCHHFMSMNHPLTIDCTDHGTWRRIGMYKCKRRFLNKTDREYDPNNPYHAEADPKFQKVYPEDPEYLSAMLAILTKYYIILYEKYEGSILNVPKPTIDQETLEYRNSQDTVNEFITKCVIRTTNNEITITSEEIAIKYREWYEKYRGERLRDDLKSISKRIENSVLCKYFETSIEHSDQIIKGIRVLEINGDFVRPGEEFLIQPKMGRPSKKTQDKLAQTSKYVMEMMNMDLGIYPLVIEDASSSGDASSSSEIITPD